MYNVNMNKQYQQTGFIPRLINITAPFIDWCYFGTEVLIQLISVCCSQVSVAWMNSLAKQKKEID